MMRALMIVAALAASARADGKAEVEKVVRANVAAAIGGPEGAFTATLAKARHVLSDADGFYLDLSSTCEQDPKADVCDGDVRIFGKSWFGKLVPTNVKPVIVVDEARGTAAFFATVDAAGKLAEEGESVTGKTQLRVAGLATKEAGGWRIAGEKFAASLPDAALFAHGNDFNDTVFPPKEDVEKAVNAWFGHLAANQAPAALGANGTAPSELATDKAALAKLAKSWDALTLKPHSWDSIVVGNMAYVVVGVKLVVPKQNSVDLDLGVVAVKDGATWKWLALDFGAVMMTRYELR